ncbi:phosphoglycolate phosphatase 2 isoform X2 [Drosophila navojoa]|uniref:phosphoglycolate phosphatase 2 isoform X2 n=1 Tax=Drosophila navojoa TaxID=7232 RepID=UPI0008463E44|nr:phosphoglycolate phosphatase 2 isoform X2 [Drosophila navojoa]
MLRRLCRVGATSWRSAKPNCQSPKVFKQLSAAEREKFFDSFDVVFCDCDGVVWYTLRDFIPGSAQALAELQRRGKRLTFVTNNSISSVAEHLHKFAEQAPLHVAKEQIVHPAQAVCDHLKAMEFGGLIYCLATPPFKQLLRDAGFRLSQEREGFVIKTLAELREAIFGGEPVDAVIIDVDFNLTATKLMRAHVQLQNPSCLFLAGAADALIPFGNGDIIGPGPFIDIVAQSTGRQPTVLGKPGEALRQLLRQHHAHVPPNRVLFVGDSLASDIGFARASGYQTLLVLTGGSSQADVDSLAAGHGHMPDYVSDCLGDLCDKYD